MSTEPHLRVALCGIGLDAYWAQFDGLRAELEGYLAHAGGQLQSSNIELVPLGLVDSAARAREAGRHCRATNADLLILYVTTYALSSTVLLLAQQAGVPDSRAEPAARAPQSTTPSSTACPIAPA